MAANQGATGAGNAPRPFILSDFVPDREDVYIDVTPLKGELTRDEIDNGLVTEFVDYPGRRIERYEIRHISELNEFERKKLGTLNRIIHAFETTDEDELVDDDYTAYTQAVESVCRLVIVNEDNELISTEIIRCVGIGEMITLCTKVLIDFFDRTTRRVLGNRAEGSRDSARDSGQEPANLSWFRKQTNRMGLRNQRT